LARVNLRRNQLIKKALRGKRNRKATLDAEAAVARACDETLVLRHRVEDGNAEISRQVGETAWPIRWQNGLPIPELSRPSKKQRSGP
jgi:hypothetical protein